MEFIEYNSENNYITIKFIILGISGTGKTFLTERINSYNNYSEFIKIKKSIELVPTIGIDFKIFCINYRNQLLKIQLLDTSGAKVFKKHALSYVRGAQAILLCYDAFNRESFNSIKKIYNELKNEYTNYRNHNIIHVLIRNKYDEKINKHKIGINDIVSDEEALEYADENNLIFSHVSSVTKNDPGIKKLFELILDKLLPGK